MEFGDDSFYDESTKEDLSIKFDPPSNDDF